METGDEDNYKDNLKEITDHLVNRRHLPLSSDDLSGINYVYHNFYMFGPRIELQLVAGQRVRWGQLRQLRRPHDGDRSEPHQPQLSLQRGELQGRQEPRGKEPDRAARRRPVRTEGRAPVGKYVRDHKATIAAFYLSNVEQYLSGSGTWVPFCRNVPRCPSTRRAPSSGRRAPRSSAIAAG